MGSYGVSLEGGIVLKNGILQRHLPISDRLLRSASVKIDKADFGGRRRDEMMMMMGERASWDDLIRKERSMPPKREL